MSLLPATTYQPPARANRSRPLKTISEYEECSFGIRSDSEGDESDRTIIARPAGLDAKLAAGATRSALSRQYQREPESPASASDCSSENSIDESPYKNRVSYAESDTGTVFSVESCPSLAGSNDTTFYTNSSRNSLASDSSRRSRNKYPGLFIPRESWQEEDAIKEVTFAMSPAQKIKISSQALSLLPQHVPPLNAPPSLGDSRSSLASNSPNLNAFNSAPITPDLHNLVPAPGTSWGGTHIQEQATAPISIALDDEEHSIFLAPPDVYAESRRQSQRASISGYSTDWSDIVHRFPEIPGATPIETEHRFPDIPGATPIEMAPGQQDFSDLRGFKAHTEDNGVQLPNDAMKLLQNLTRSYSPDPSASEATTVHEMKERSDVGVRQNIDTIPAPETPLSDYSFSQLSIPSPGGFFSSLQASSRATWCAPNQPKMPSMPSSAVAENFYDAPFQRAEQTFETILELPQDAVTDGPPTARQPGFAIPADYQDSVSEDSDMYGSQPTVRHSPPSSNAEVGFEYDTTYEQDLKQAAGANLDRTGDWLSAQTTYLSALRETNPLNDPAEYIPQTPHPLDDENEQSQNTSAQKAVHFLEAALAASDSKSTEPKPTKTLQPTSSVFLEAFEFCYSQKGRKDAFLQASTRLESINSTRIAMPVRHIHSLLNTQSTDTLQLHSRPKYRGPYSQNPRATGNFSKTTEQMLFAEAEQKQQAMEHILPSVWVTEAQRQVLNKGRLFACMTANKRMTEGTKKRRILDLAGAATASWAWTAARKWSHVKIFTVQHKTQSQLAAQWPVKDSVESIKPENPANHKVITVQQLWKLPFRDNFFDVISTRTLHMFLRSRPVPEMPSINEWDLTLKECMRVLKPNGILDFMLLDSHISNNSSENKSSHSRNNSSEGNASISPTAAYGQSMRSPPPTATFAQSAGIHQPISQNLSKELGKRGFDADGGSSKMSDRLQAAGFTHIQRQWVGLPIGQTGAAHDNVIASYDLYEAEGTKPQAPAPSIQRSKIGSVSHANGRARTPFPAAPRPISEVSSISRIIEQYSNVEAVHGPVGSTADISDMAGLLGASMWEEWLVRHRLDILHSRKQVNDTDNNAIFEAENLLHGINDILAVGHDKGACFRVLIGWAKKPGDTARCATLTQHTQPMVQQPISIDTSYRQSSYHSRAAQLAKSNSAYEGLPSDETPTTANTVTPIAYQYYGRSSRFAFQTPVSHMRRGDLTLETRGLRPVTFSPNFTSPNFTESAVERGEVGTIPMMIIE